jgi:hypothetical protein
VTENIADFAGKTTDSSGVNSIKSGRCGLTNKRMKKNGMI